MIYIEQSFTIDWFYIGYMYTHTYAHRYTFDHIK